MKVFFKANRTLPNDSINDFIEKAGLKDHEYHCASCNSYFSEEETARKQKYDYIVYIFSDFLMRDVYFNEVAMEAVLDIESFTSKVIIIDEIKTEIKTPNKILSNLHNKIADHGGYWFGKIDTAANFIYNKKMAEKPKEKQEAQTNAFDKYQKNVLHFNELIGPCYVFDEFSMDTREVIEKYRKVLVNRSTPNEDVKNKLGDMLWYLSSMADVFNFKFSEIADGNIEKLKKRKEEGSLMATEIENRG